MELTYCYLIRFGISGFPTIKFFPGSGAEAEAYEGPREVEAFVEYINGKVGTQRQADGSLLPTTGRLEALDALIVGAGYEVTAALVTSLQETAATLGAEAQAYVSAAQKVLAKGGAIYVNKELARLEGLIAGKSIVPEKKAAFQLRRNVLAAFRAEA